MAGKDALQSTIQHTLWKLHEIEATVSHSGKDGSEAPADEQQTLLQKHINELVGQLGTMHAQAAGLQDVHVPTSILGWMDEGGNPDDFVKAVFQDCQRDNQVSKGVLTSFRQLMKGLDGEADIATSEGAAAPPAAVKDEAKVEAKLEIGVKKEEPA